MGSYNLAVVFSPTLLRPANATEETPESIKTMTTITQVRGVIITLRQKT